MEGTQGGNFSKPDETRTFPHGKWELVHLGNVTVAKGTMEPGWRWSEHVKPIAGTDSCQLSHHGYVISGRLGIRMDDGSEAEYGPGDAYVVGPGHDGWTVGNEPVVALEFSSSAPDYARGS